MEKSADRPVLANALSVRPKPAFYGAPIGILMLQRPDDPFDRPYVPGSVGNVSTWSVPARYKAVSNIGG